MQTDAGSWAVEEFGAARLGDARLTARLVAMGARAACAPAGRITEVFDRDAERQGAYDFLESRRVRSDALLASAQQACAARAASFDYVFVPLDGTSVKLTDRRRTKDFGAVGSLSNHARGLKLIDAIAVSPGGTCLGVAAMRWWSRGSEARAPIWRRTADDSETVHWLDAIRDVVEVFERHAPRTKAWFQLDREGDAWRVLKTLEDTGHLFTVRSNGTRRVRAGDNGLLRPCFARRRPLGHTLVEVPGSAHRRERLACLAVRAGRVTLQLRNKWNQQRVPLDINVVHVREVGTTPRNEKPLDWMLLTNAPVDTQEQAEHVVFGYTQRWRIEEVHRAWKSVCQVESTQLHKRRHVQTWATLLFAVAVRIERLKQLARETPDRPASDELTALEIRALILAKRNIKKRTEKIPDTMPTIGSAVTWIAELGGYTGKSSGGPPGSTTIARGLEKLKMIAVGVALASGGEFPNE